VSDDTAQAAGEGMSEERLAEIKAWVGPGSLRGRLAAKGSEAEMAAELVVEVEHLRERLAEIGETREEWGYRLCDTSGNSTPWAPLGGQEIATAMVNMKREQGSDARLGQRLASEWRDVERQADGG